MNLVVTLWSRHRTRSNVPLNVRPKSDKRPLRTSGSLEQPDAECEATDCSHGRFQERTTERAEQILSHSHASGLRANIQLRRTQALTLSSKASLLWLSPLGTPAP